MTVYNNSTELIGNTPIVKINKLVNYDNIEILVKMESYNPGGSIKDRIALNMIKKAEENGDLKTNGTIVEPTSGNTGIGLALIAAQRNYNIILVMPDTMSKERRTLLKSLGAEVILTPGKKGMNGSIKKAKKLVENNKSYFMPEQFKNPANPEAHRKNTAEEILNDLGEDIDYFTAGVGTGGTITGIASVLKSKIENIQIAAVEPKNSAVISGEKAGPHKLQGIGAGFIPDILEENLIDRIIKIKNSDAYDTARKMAKLEGLFVGISAGANICSAIKLAEEMHNKGEKGKILTIAPDSGERYLSTDLFNKS